MFKYRHFHSKSPPPWEFFLAKKENARQRVCIVLTKWFINIFVPFLEQIVTDLVYSLFFQLQRLYFALRLSVDGVYKADVDVDADVEAVPAKAPVAKAPLAPATR